MCLPVTSAMYMLIHVASGVIRPFLSQVGSKQTRNVIVTFSIGFKLVTLNLTFGKRSANVYILCRHIFDV